MFAEAGFEIVVEQYLQGASKEGALRRHLSGKAEKFDAFPAAREMPSGLLLVGRKGRSGIAKETQLSLDFT